MIPWASSPVLVRNFDKSSFLHDVCLDEYGPAAVVRLQADLYVLLLVCNIHVLQVILLSSSYFCWCHSAVISSSAVTCFDGIQVIGVLHASGNFAVTCCCCMAA